MFLLDNAGKPHEMTPMCVLDFYVTEKRQRTGCGKKLFETMLRRENVDPRYLAVDRPSDKLISFLRKHYNLANIIPQVIFLGENCPRFYYCVETKGMSIEHIDFQ